MKYYCPRCKSEARRTPSFIGGDCKTWYECPKCNTYIHTYRPLAHQAAVHSDNHRFIGNFGGYGTGKTTTSREEVVKHLLITPDALIIIGANIQRQYEQTIKREFESDIPAAFVRGYSVQKQTMDFINGARIVWTPFDDPDKLRSMNSSMFVILEASEVKGDAYTQLNTRNRNMVAGIPLRDENGDIVYEELPNGDVVPVMKNDWRKGIIESNPDAGWIRNEILLRSHRIYQHATFYDYFQDPNRILPSVSSHIAASKVNPYLPKGWEADLRAKNADWWVKRYLEGSFQYSEGLVYPNAMAHIVPYFEIPKHWPRIVAFDYGIADKAAFVFGAIDERGGVLYIYRVVTAKDRNVEQLAKMYHLAASDIPAGGLLTSPIIDPKSGPKRDYNLRTLADQFLDFGISFQPGAVNVDARIYRLNSYIEAGKLKIFETCTELIDELQNYRFKERTLTDTDRSISKPIDKDNHAINGLEWIVMELPHDPRQILNGIHNRLRSYDSPPPEEKLWMFSDDENSLKGGHEWY